MVCETNTANLALIRSEILAANDRRLGVAAERGSDQACPLDISQTVQKTGPARFFIEIAISTYRRPYSAPTPRSPRSPRLRVRPRPTCAPRSQCPSWERANTSLPPRSGKVSRDRCQLTASEHISRTRQTRAPTCSLCVLRAFRNTNLQKLAFTASFFTFYPPHLVAANGRAAKPTAQSPITSSPVLRST